LPIRTRPDTHEAAHPTTPATVSRTSIEVNTLNRPNNPSGPEPTGDDDPTGVRALLSSLPAPDTMPKDLVERINASLAAEQAQRATRLSGSSATPLVATARRRRARLLFAIASAAAAVVAVVAVAVGTNIFTADRGTSISGSAAIAPSASAGQDRGGAPLSAPKAPGAATAAAASLVQIGLSATRYTQADFVTQAETLRRSTTAPIQPQPAESSGLGPAATDAGLRECLIAIGASSAQVVRADVAFYEGQPAVIIVAVTNGIPKAYAVGRQCSPGDAAVLRPATPLS